MGCILYVAVCTRPDICYAVCNPSKFLEKPGENHWKAAIRIVRYLKTTMDLGLCFHGKQHGGEAIAFSDSDLGSNLDDRRSVSGVMVMLHGAPVVFKSKYQRTVALISAEAEYMALSLCVQDVL
ncbi:hypothetical protein PsorP6_007158 [Peronosclerospora sorghi]|uniref:Uncharacterized protein n=1 Tax=Peronosclerospora sorghi TaxID=230839 RepID=A0ACC0W7A1_9STRA|nr:hypothetical protein PsorP6_007158 [Peronosclerospora sorghi]